MNILFVSAVLPYPLYSGGQVRIYNLLRRLSQKHEITLCSYVRNASETEYVGKLDFCREVHVVVRGRALQPRYLWKAAVSSRSWLTSTYDLGSMRELVSDLLHKNRYDLLHLEPFYVYPGIPETDVPVVVGEHNVEYDVYGRYIGSSNPLLHPFMIRDVAKMKSEEERIWKTAKAVIAVSGEDAGVIRPFNGKTTVVSNGVDTSWFRFVPHRVGSSPRCLFVGNFSWGPNTDALKYLMAEVWPAVIAAFPGATLTVVGKHAPAQLVRSGMKGLRYEPFVEDIRDVMEKSDVMLAPMRIPGGSKYKIIESMASGLPVVTSDAGSTGFDAVPGRHLLVAKSSEGYAAAIRSLVDDPGKTGKMVDAARLLAEEKYDWNALADIQDRVWREAV